ncbi:hypothetical protein AB1K54_15840 [Microbacterium sp. BWT-B31]|uniref:hypothetical protein n=1 Tax=Microbacterium sp. BWT-B31 TaxID=3232072 RepID=UPI0035290CA1
MAYTGHGASKMPREDRDAVALLGQVHRVDLMPAVESALAAAEAVDMSDVPLPSETAGETFRSRLAAARPDLTTEARAALADTWLFRRLWLDLPAQVENPRVQYFARFGIEDGERVPWALYRRVRDGESVVDSVLKDVGEWRADRNRVIWSSTVNPLEADIEPISARQALEFEQMVAERRYRPFST